MGFTMRSYGELKEQFKLQVTALRGEHKVATVEELPLHRRCQVECINAAITDLNNVNNNFNLIYTDEEKARILSGLMLVTMDKIAESSYISAKRSLLYAGLEDAVGISKDNKLDPNSAATMICEAMKYVAKVTFENGDTTQLLLEKHSFSAIKGFDLGAFWDRGNNLIAEHRKAIFAEAQAVLIKTIMDRQEMERKVKGEGGYFSGFFTNNSKKTSFAKSSYQNNNNNNNLSNN